jgi:exodeoxyribonuclease VII large subunit
MWRSAAARALKMPNSGDAVEVHGRVSMYETRGDVQLYVDEIKLAGAGALWQEFERLRNRLEAEGLFAAERKRPLPRFPRTIGVVTSREGAVFHDICNILRRRYPLVEVLLAPTQVQGQAAEEMIATALATINRYEIDLVILARGGGSIEDLWCFNAERVARAIYSSRVPVISAVGHETDFTIADFVADIRAPTPSAAAELAVSDTRDLLAAIFAAEQRLAQLTRDRLGDARVRLSSGVYALLRSSPQARVANYHQRVDDASRRMTSRTLHLLALDREQLNGALRHLAALNPEATLGRGYAIVQDKETGRVVKKKAQAAGHRRVQVRVSDGEFEATTDA